MAIQDDNVKRGFYLVYEGVLPTAIRKTIRAKELMLREPKISINAAVEQMDLSRSAYYRYKDCVYPFYEAVKQQKIYLSLLIEHQTDVLLKVLKALHKDGAVVVTMNQNLPRQGAVTLDMTIDTAEMKPELEKAVDNLRAVSGVKRVEIVGFED